MLLIRYQSPINVTVLYFSKSDLICSKLPAMSNLWHSPPYPPWNLMIVSISIFPIASATCEHHRLALALVLVIRYPSLEHSVLGRLKYVPFCSLPCRIRVSHLGCAEERVCPLASLWRRSNSSSECIAPTSTMQVYCLRLPL